MRTSILYITYDGLMEPLGQSQVLAYQERLAENYDIHILSFEKPKDWNKTAAREALAKRIQAAGIHWHPLPYHKKPSALATAWDILCGIRAGMRLIRKHDIRIVHARSYVPSVMALALKRVTSVKFIFDMRGFWADERVDGGLWPRGGRMYRLAKWFERKFLLNADHVVSLTNAAIAEIRRFDYLADRQPSFTTITTCTDLSRFVPQPSPGEGFIVGYVGSAGTWYLFNEVLTCFQRLCAQRPDARLLIINRNEHDFIRGRLQAHDIPGDRVELRSAAHSEVPLQIARMHVGIFFIKPVFSKLASAPTKLGEFLGCGVPCLTNAGVGDMADILESENVGVAIDAFDAEALDRGIRHLLQLVADPTIQNRCVDAAHRNFRLEAGVQSYEWIYQKLERIN